MSASRDTSPLAPPGPSLHALLPQQQEALIMLIVLNFAAEHGLLNAEQLEDARASLRALFVHATGEETMLRKLIGMLRINHALNKTFGEMSLILDAIRRSSQALIQKYEEFKQQLAALAVTPEENARFVGPLLDFAGGFVRAVGDFDRQMVCYTAAREAEARAAQVFRLAQEARARLKQRLDQGAAVESREEERVREKVFRSFNYAEAEAEYRQARRSAQGVRAGIDRLLGDFHHISQLAMKPDMRSAGWTGVESAAPPFPDIHLLCVQGMEAWPRLQPLLPAMQELLRLYQRSYGMFMLDFDKFNNALGPLLENTEDYFQAKEQDEDVRSKQRKLEQIEALIAFIEGCFRVLRNGAEYTYPKFSLAVSALIARPAAPWAAIAEPLLQMKVVAEAELTTRLA